jgi:ribonuclease HI
MSEQKNLLVYIDASSEKSDNRLYSGYGIIFDDKKIANMSEPFIIEPCSEDRAKLYAIYTAVDKFSSSKRYNKLTININSIKNNNLYILNRIKNKKLKINNLKLNRDVVKLIFDLIDQFHESQREVIFNLITADNDSYNDNDTNYNTIMNEVKKLADDGVEKSKEFFKYINKTKKPLLKKIRATTSIDKYTYDNDGKEYYLSDIKIVRKQEPKRKKKIIMDIK